MSSRKWKSYAQCRQDNPNGAIYKHHKHKLFRPIRSAIAGKWVICNPKDYDGEYGG